MTGRVWGPLTSREHGMGEHSSRVPGATGSGTGHLPRGIASILCAGRTRLKTPGATMTLWKRRDERSRDLFLSAQWPEADGGEGVGREFWGGGSVSRTLIVVGVYI